MDDKIYLVAFSLAEGAFLFRVDAVREGLARRRRGEAAFRCLTDAPRHGMADRVECEDDVIDGDDGLHARKRHVSRKHRMHGAEAVALDAWHFDEARNGVAGEAEEVLDGERAGIGNLSGRAAGELDECSGRHARRCAALGLAAALGPRNRSILVDDHADAGRCKERTDNGVIACLALLARSVECRGHDAAAAGRRARDDAAHDGIDFADANGIGRRRKRRCPGTHG